MTETYRKTLDTAHTKLLDIIVNQDTVSLNDVMFIIKSMEARRPKMKWSQRLI